MSKALKFLLLIFPFLTMIIVNEVNRKLNPPSEVYKFKGFTSELNSGKVNIDKCTWYCHTDTGYCKRNHVKFLKPYYSYTDPIYFGIIDALHKTGNYGLANIIFLVTLIPLMIWYLAVKCIDYEIEIRAIKTKMKKQN